MRFRRGFSLIELLIAIAIILIIGKMAIPKLMDAIMHANETSAKQSIKAIHAAQVQFYSQSGRFALNFAELAAPAGGRRGLLPADLAEGEKSGYRFSVRASEGGYEILAVPVKLNSTGRCSFFSDDGLVIRETSSGAVP